MFRIDPSKVEDGKGKSPYDPRHNAASVLIGNRTITKLMEHFNRLTILMMVMSLRSSNI